MKCDCGSEEAPTAASLPLTQRTCSPAPVSTSKSNLIQMRILTLIINLLQPSPLSLPEA